MADEIEFTAEEQAYVDAALIRLSSEEREPTTLERMLEHWASFVDDMENPRRYQYLEELARGVFYRETIDEYFVRDAPPLLQAKFEELLRATDDLYRAKTLRVSRPWFGYGRLQGWWWFRNRPDMAASYFARGPGQ